MELKKPTTYKEQLMLFKQRGCIVEDDNFALKTLENVNYYRLTAYFLPFKKADDNYIQGTSFTNVIDIYEFDRRLRILLLSLLEGLETRLKK